MINQQPTFLRTLALTLFSFTALTFHSYAQKGKTGQLPYLLSYHKPATHWVEALPLGNGRLGAMVYGDPAKEDIQLNENTVWAGGPYRNDNPMVKDSLSKLRQLIFEDKFVEAEALAVKAMVSKGAQGMPYQTVATCTSPFRVMIDTPIITGN